MQKRQTYSPMSIPVVYAPFQDSGWPAYPGKRRKPGVLPIFELTYLHFHDVLEIGMCISGNGICNVEGVEYPFSAGDIQIVFPYQCHLSKNTQEESCRWYWVYIDPQKVLTKHSLMHPGQIAGILQEASGTRGILNRRKYPDACKLVEGLIQQMYEPKPDMRHREQYYAASVYMLLMELCQCGTETAESVHYREMEEIAPALLRIRQAVEDGQCLAVATLHEACAMSLSGFRRKFKAAVGVSPKEYLTLCRVFRACQMLKNTDKKVIDIAQKCGFEDISGFNRCFLKYMNTTPRAYRKQEI